MADYIDRNELVGNLDRFAPEHFIPLIRTLIEKQPTADVEEVVRCKDCKYFKQDKKDICAGYCNHYMFGLNERICKSDFCSYGERIVDNDV